MLQIEVRVRPATAAGVDAMRRTGATPVVHTTFCSLVSNTVVSITVVSIGATPVVRVRVRG